MLLHPRWASVFEPARVPEGSIANTMSSDSAMSAAADRDLPPSDQNLVPTRLALGHRNQFGGPAVRLYRVADDYAVSHASQLTTL
jgi:hypothetical protein